MFVIIDEVILKPRKKMISAKSNIFNCDFWPIGFSLIIWDTQTLELAYKIFAQHQIGGR
jgi:hypothetical protein